MPSEKQQTSFAFLTQPLFRSILIPGLFVVLWGNGFIGAKLVLPSSSPWTVLCLRFFIVAALLAGLGLLLRKPWPKGKEALFHLSVLGILLHAFYLGGAFIGMDTGIEAATSALIGALPPLFTALAAWFLIGEKLSAIGWLGIALGILGVFVVVSDRMGLGIGTGYGFVANFLGAVALALSAAYQKRFVQQFSWITGGAVQFFAAALFAGVMMILFEDGQIKVTRDFVLGMVLLVFVLSLGAVSLLQFLIKQGAATGVMSLLFLVPVSTALEAWPLFGETFSRFSLVGFAFALLGVWLVQKGIRK